LYKEDKNHQLREGHGKSSSVRESLQLPTLLADLDDL